MNRISKILSDRMKELDISEYRLCKDNGIIQQSFNSSLKSENSWNSAIVLYKACKYLGLDFEEVVSDEKPDKQSLLITKLIRENKALKEDFEKEKIKNKKFSNIVKVIKTIDE